MVKPNNVSKLLAFPAPSPLPAPLPLNWDFQILETKDNLMNALELLRNAYNEMLAGKAVEAAENILAQVEAILKINEKLPPHTVVAAVKIHAPIAPNTERKVLLLFPSGKSAVRMNTVGTISRAVALD
jgi:hypothetical protein